MKGFFAPPPWAKNAEIIEFISLWRLSKAINSSNESGKSSSRSKPGKTNSLSRVEIIKRFKFSPSAKLWSDEISKSALLKLSKKSDEICSLAAKNSLISRKKFSLLFFAPSDPAFFALFELPALAFFISVFFTAVR